MLTHINIAICGHTSHYYFHYDVIKWKHFPRYWPFVQAIHRWIPLTKASVSRSFDVFFDLCLNKRLSKQSIEMPVTWYTVALIMTSLLCSDPHSRILHLVQFTYVMMQPMLPSGAVNENYNSTESPDTTDTACVIYIESYHEVVMCDCVKSFERDK